MIGLLRKAMLLACSGVLAASSAMAGIPTPIIDMPCGINLVGTTSGIADVKGQFRVIIRDEAQNPIPGVYVVIDFNGCAPDIRVCSVQPFGGVTAGCPGREVSAVTDATGTAVLRIVGAASNTGNSPAAGYKCATVYADNYNMGKIQVGAFDQNGGGGVNPADLSLFLGDSFDVDFEGRSDYDCSNTVNPADLSLILGVSLGSGSFNSCTAYCN